MYSTAEKCYILMAPLAGYATEGHHWMAGCSQHIHVKLTGKEMREKKSLISNSNVIYFCLSCRHSCQLSLWYNPCVCVCILSFTQKVELK